MEDIKQLTIESVEVFRTGSSAKGVWNLYNVRANGEKYSTFLDLTPGKTATFKIETKPSDKIDPKTGQPYINRTIVGYTGSIDNMPAKPYRSSTEAKPADSPVAKFEASLAECQQQLLDLAQVVNGLLNRVEVLETPAFDAINSKADDPDMPTF